MTTDTFYADLDVVETFEMLADPDTYRSLPDDWVVGMADIEGSTAAIDSGRYKVVNTVGAAVISSQINVHDGLVLPYVFGGDGAAFAVPESRADVAREALASTKRWALDEFGFELRASLVPVRTIRQAGHDVRVARHRAAPQAVYAMFGGGGVAWAEERMKAGENLIEAAPPGTAPDLTGLSCRWTPMKSSTGHILTLLVVPEREDAATRAAIREVVHLTDGLDRHGTPVPPEGPGYQWVPAGLELEARATRIGPKHTMSLAKRKAQLLAETFIAWVFYKTGMKAGGFDARHYTRTTGANADFRKFDDGLKMTLDCPPHVRQKLESILEAAQNSGLLRYALLEQDSAIMTCIVPSVMTDDHVHFVDGAQGGYTRAAAALKSAAH